MDNTLWLGYDGLALPFTDICAVLYYRPALDRRITRAYGSVPRGIHAVVVNGNGDYLPTRWHVDQIRAHLRRWRSMVK
jgi:hypothetical protein